MIAYHAYNLPDWLVVGAVTWMALAIIGYLFTFGAGKANKAHDRWNGGAE